jgi:hypothetical protein
MMMALSGCGLDSMPAPTPTTPSKHSVQADDSAGAMKSIIGTRRTDPEVSATAAVTMALPGHGLDLTPTPTPTTMPTGMLIQSPLGHKAMIYCKETLPQSIYKISQRVYAKDDSTGLLRPAFIRMVMWGPKSDKVNVGCCSPLLVFGNAGENDRDDK